MARASSPWESVESEFHTTPVANCSQLLVHFVMFFHPQLTCSILYIPTLLFLALFLKLLPSCRIVPDTEPLQSNPCSQDGVFAILLVGTLKHLHDAPPIGPSDDHLPCSDSRKRPQLPRLRVIDMDSIQLWNLSSHSTFRRGSPRAGGPNGAYSPSVGYPHTTRFTTLSPAANTLEAKWLATIPK